MRKLTLCLRLATFVLAWLVSNGAPESALAANKGKCKIIVTQTVHSGRARERIFYTLASNEAHCAAKAKHHGSIFDPTKLKKKKVTYKYSESR